MGKKTITIRLSDDIYEKLKLLAAEDCITISAYIEMFVADAYIEMLVANKFKSYIASGVSDMVLYPKALSKKEVEKIYKK